MTSFPSQERAHWFHCNDVVDQQTQAITIKQMWDTKSAVIRIDFEFIRPLS